MAKNEFKKCLQVTVHIIKVLQWKKFTETGIFFAKMATDILPVHSCYKCVPLNTVWHAVNIWSDHVRGTFIQ